MTILKKLVAASAAALIVFQSLVASAAIDAYLYVSGPKGEIQGHSARDPRATTVLEFTHGTTSPRDLQSGLATGKRMHEPITLVMKMDTATSQMWKALKQNDKLQVKVAFYRPAVSAITGTPPAAQQPYHTLTLGDAAIEKLEIVSPDKVQDPGSKTGAEYLKVQFTYQKIEWTWTDGGKTTAADDWTL
ncbi:MAG TPA: type VI secretion system tube protein TssD [Polyangiaceae bacterium]